METTSTSTSSKGGPGSRSLIERLKSLIRFRGAPDTTEELESEIQELLEEGEEQGLITSQEEKLITSIFDFREIVASEIMTPSAEVVFAEDVATVDELIQIINDEGYTRIPIYHETQDHIVGILHAKDLLRICAKGPDATFNLKDYLNSPTFIAESKPITELLMEFQAQKNHMAIVTDEFGGVRGLITLEDVIEEIVGEIDDEHDQEERELRVIDDHAVIVDAKIDVEEVENHFGVTLPEGPYESVGGFIIFKLGKVPDTGSVVDYESLKFHVLGADKRRIKTVRVARNEEHVEQA